MFGKGIHSAPKEVDVDLNRVVTPMLDMTFQILFFLIMNFRMPTPEGQVDLLLPKQDEGEPLMQQEDKLDKDKSDEYRLRVLIYKNIEDQQGTIAGLTWKLKEDQQAVSINDVDPADRNEKDEYFLRLSPRLYGLVEKLREYQPKKDGKQPTIKIECDNKLRYSELLRIMDIMRKLNFNNVGVMPIPKGK